MYINRYFKTKIGKTFYFADVVTQIGEFKIRLIWQL